MAAHEGRELAAAHLCAPEFVAVWDGSHSHTGECLKRHSHSDAIHYSIKDLENAIRAYATGGSLK